MKLHLYLIGPMHITFEKLHNATLAIGRPVLLGTIFDMVCSSSRRSSDGDHHEQLRYKPLDSALLVQSRPDFPSG